ncbi:hypothetical protein FHT44_006525 [Mycolicibacterium sp. BK634]|uniref:DUF5666 domain-containing protein n=1 Tax=Mycolicibacterium sp. BK634 TaxID=2587099 RepID=UPI00161E49A9|nr:DUF5666 domain-containing protein [Mycolicibacterium sp. BK634]MBB3754003.1 hypothetical protein [Mycolicibacterium sp. BK634]
MTLPVPASLMRRGYALPVLVGITALSIAACGSSSTTSSSSPQSAPPGTTSAAAPTPSGSSPAAKGGGKYHAAGLITSVTGSTLTLRNDNANSTVGFSSATKVSELTPAALTDVKVGSCVSVRPARGTSPAPDGSVTAVAVTVSTPRDGQCFPNARPSAGSPTSAPPSGRPGHGGLRGTVSSVGDNTLVVTTAGGNAPANVGLSGTTTYTKRAPSDVQAIAQGKCLTARGTTDGNGTLQADVISLRPADNGTCPSMRH